MSANKFKTYGSSVSSANIYTDAEWSSYGPNSNPISGDTVSSKQLNTALKQATLMSAALGDVISGTVTEGMNIGDISLSMTQENLAKMIVKYFETKINSTKIHFNGSLINLDGVYIYAPISAGDSTGQLLISKAEGSKPGWLSQGTAGQYLSSKGTNQAPEWKDFPTIPTVTKTYQHNIRLKVVNPDLSPSKKVQYLSFSLINSRSSTYTYAQRRALWTALNGITTDRELLCNGVVLNSTENPFVARGVTKAQQQIISSNSYQYFVINGYDDVTYGEHPIYVACSEDEYNVLKNVVNTLHWYISDEGGITDYVIGLN